MKIESIALLAACAMTVFAVSSPLAAAPSDSAPADEAGMLAFNNHCRQCHSYKPGDQRLGPSLAGVVGRKAGALAGYDNYSPSLKNSDIVWTPELLDRWMQNPEAVVPGNNMGSIFAGLDDAQQRQMVIEFLKSTKDDHKVAAKP